jgi:hypothetical protein
MCLLIFVNFVISAAVALKILVILQSLAWADRYGETYRARLDELRTIYHRTPTLEELVARSVIFSPKK